MMPTKAEREARKLHTDYDFIIGQGRRKNDTAFIEQQRLRAQPHEYQGTPTQHGAHLMRSYHEASWAEHFESHGFPAAPVSASAPYAVPCYFYEPYGMKRWSEYPTGHHYRIDFALVKSIAPYLYRERQKDEGKTRYRATSWQWVSIKPENFDRWELDRRYLEALVRFDSLHQTAMQICGLPAKPHRIYLFKHNRPVKIVDRRCTS